MRIKDETKVHSVYKATLKLVKDRGLAGITMGDISKAASIATGTLYIYFKNKDELIKALFTECRQHSAEQYFAGLDDEASFELRMKRLFDNIISYKMAHFEVSIFLEQSYHSPFGCSTDLRKKQKALDPLYALIAEGIAQRKIKEIDPELVATFLFG
ncbi:MAG TPA: TetR/AcrR family transcriptional regulator, partial [Flavisolibacter sp.]|nr:TetR/AcrR family transcriptional regulator [Flavisolibacter sp.]